MIEASGKTRELPAAKTSEEEYLKARIKELESVLVVVRDELWASSKKDCEAFIQIAIEQTGAWVVARHTQTHIFCLNQIHDVLEG